MNVCVIGTGGREHTLAWRLNMSPSVETVYAIPGSAAMTDVATVVAADTTPLVTTGKSKTKQPQKVTKKPPLPKVPQEAVATEKTLRDAKVKQNESAKVASTGQTQVNSMCKNPDLGDWAPVPCPNV